MNAKGRAVERRQRVVPDKCGRKSKTRRTVAATADAVARAITANDRAMMRALRAIAHDQMQRRLDAGEKGSFLIRDLACACVDLTGRLDDADEWDKV